MKDFHDGCADAAQLEVGQRGLATPGHGAASKTHAPIASAGVSTALADTSLLSSLCSERASAVLRPAPAHLNPSRGTNLAMQDAPGGRTARSSSRSLRCMHMARGPACRLRRGPRALERGGSLRPEYKSWPRPRVATAVQLDPIPRLLSPTSWKLKARSSLDFIPNHVELT
ncbi:hypothetical protein K491DRAFT_472604 [Lophiostoma macrostomum CBS 122681]|uniref:Uncharacterized protein n=1 Tax=Lophiostoma macrostomum CBS 122681 TaxID=1314788 RepID=A0A6A6T5I0_9PLEO|nr:hypothetical protein K491DRAFT_472604 [Lophiostoma macrostomum CBS 122681]